MIDTNSYEYVKWLTIEKEYSKLIKKYDEERQKYEDTRSDIHNKIKATFLCAFNKQFGNLAVSFYIGAKDQIHLSAINGIGFYRDGWGVRSAISGPGLNYGEKKKGPFEIELLRSFVKQFFAETGFRIELYKFAEAPIKKSEFECRSYVELEAFYESKGIEITFVGEGYKEYRGWDCTDYYVIVKVSMDTETAFWTTDAHGGNFSKSETRLKGEQWVEFKQFLESDV